MKKIIISIFILFSCMFSSTSDSSLLIQKYINIKSNFSINELQGVWLKINCKLFQEYTNTIDINEKKYQSIYFKKDRYIGYSSDLEHLYKTKDSILKFHKFKLLNSSSINQWIMFSTNKADMYFKITKIDINGVLKKSIDGKVYVNFIEGDMILSLYNYKTKKIVYRLQYRKIKL